MKKLTYHQLREMWLGFLREKGHAVIPSASVVPENDASTLFTTAGMQPLVPYLLGETHPAGKRIANIQRCIRTNDIDEVGDISHLTFFEMMGNWSLGDYFKKEKIAWSYEFLTSPKYLAIPQDRIHVTCFEGDKVNDGGDCVASTGFTSRIPRDEECAQYWHEQGIPKDRIHFFPKSENWWAVAGGVGPQGPCSEMFFHTDSCKCGKKCKCNPAENCGCFVELGNDVYMQYVVEKTGSPCIIAKQQNVDTGWGLERILCFVNGQKSVYETELFAPAIEIVGENSVPARIVAEHTRAACVIISDGVVPSNTGAGYVLRRLIRRAVRMANKLNVPRDVFEKLINFYNTYLEFDRGNVTKIFLDEVTRFEKTLETGLKEFEKVIGYLKTKELSGKTAFRLYETYGFPIELTQELAKERGLTINMTEYDEAKVKHAAASAAASAAAGAFKGGLSSTGDATTRLHTATHILLAVLREKFGSDVTQKGSNITPERLRFDFNLNRKVEKTELDEIERRVNEVIARNLDITMCEMTVADAKKSGATGVFDSRYGERVKVYSIGDFTSEICGGPHAANTGNLGIFKIQKEESVAAGVRRIKAVLAKG